MKRYRKNVPIKGFRAGHVPMSYEKMYGQAIFGDKWNDLLAERALSVPMENKTGCIGATTTIRRSGTVYFKLDSPDPEYAVKYDRVLCLILS
ncbi:MAG: trigger factor [Saprospiraceae bacterium]